MLRLFYLWIRQNARFRFFAVQSLNINIMGIDDLQYIAGVGS